MDFESAGPSVIKSIKQRELLNGWLALYAREQSLPQLEDYRPRLRVVIDREFRYRPPARILGDLLEFS